jgi:uncharacterized DUF497 family protein
MHTIAGYEWDLRKASRNIQKHGVYFADAATVFSDEQALKILDEDSEAFEDRFIILGMSCPGQVLAVVYTWRGDRIRIISARKATAGERSAYERRT